VVPEIPEATLELIGSVERLPLVAGECQNGFQPAAGGDEDRAIIGGQVATR
jgi:hypothetical protein